MKKLIALALTSCGFGFSSCSTEQAPMVHPPMNRDFPVELNISIEGINQSPDTLEIPSHWSTRTEYHLAGDLIFNQQGYDQVQTLTKSHMSEFQGIKLLFQSPASTFSLQNISAEINGQFVQELNAYDQPNFRLFSISSINELLSEPTPFTAKMGTTTTIAQTVNIMSEASEIVAEDWGTVEGRLAKFTEGTLYPFDGADTHAEIAMVNQQAYLKLSIDENGASGQSFDIQTSSNTDSWTFLERITLKAKPGFSHYHRFSDATLQMIQDLQRQGRTIRIIHPDFKQEMTFPTVTGA